MTEQRWRVRGYTADQQTDVIYLVTRFHPALDVNDPTFRDEIHRLASLARVIWHQGVAVWVEIIHLLTVDLWRDGQWCEVIPFSPPTRAPWIPAPAPLPRT